MFLGISLHLLHIIYFQSAAEREVCSMTGRRPRPVTGRRHSEPILRTTTFQTNPRNQIFLPFPPFLYPSNSFPTFRPRIVKYLKSISAHFCVHQIGQDLTPSLHKKVLVHI